MEKILEQSKNIGLKKENYGPRKKQGLGVYHSMKLFEDNGWDIEGLPHNNFCDFIAKKGDKKLAVRTKYGSTFRFYTEEIVNLLAFCQKNACLPGLILITEDNSFALFIGFDDFMR